MKGRFYEKRFQSPQEVGGRGHRRPEPSHSAHLKHIGYREQLTNKQLVNGIFSNSMPLEKLLSAWIALRETKGRWGGTGAGVRGGGVGRGVTMRDSSLAPVPAH